MKSSKTVNYISLLSIFLLSACYTFNPAKTSPVLSEIKTFSVSPFVDEGGSPANLPLKITEKIRNYFQQNTRLILVKDNADLNIDGKITGYSTAPNAIGSNALATSNRLTISIAVNYTLKESSNNLSASQFAEYDANKPLPSVESSLNEDLTNKLVIDVFNGIFTW